MVSNRWSFSNSPYKPRIAASFHCFWSWSSFIETSSSSLLRNSSYCRVMDSSIIPIRFISFESTTGAGSRLVNITDCVASQPENDMASAIKTYKTKDFCIILFLEPVKVLPTEPTNPCFYCTKKGNKWCNQVKTRSNQPTQ